MPPLKVEIVFEYVFDRERGICSKTEENDEKACTGCEDVRKHQLDVWLEGYDNYCGANAEL